MKIVIGSFLAYICIEKVEMSNIDSNLSEEKKHIQQLMSEDPRLDGVPKASSS